MILLFCKNLISSFLPFCAYHSIFDELLEQPGDPKWLDDIRKDLHRQFPTHEMFTESDGPGYNQLFYSFVGNWIFFNCFIDELTTVRWSCFAS